jgi:hypothetical protein
MRAGAWAVAVVGAITRSEDARGAIAALRQATVSAARVPPARALAFARTTLDGQVR